MGLDLRKPIALLFVIYGALLMLYGWLGSSVPHARLVNVGWGAILLAFGLGLALLAHRSP